MSVDEDKKQVRLKDEGRVKQVMVNKFKFYPSE